MPAKKPGGTRRDYHYSVWVNPDERTELDDAARAAREDNTSTWLRKIGQMVARGELVERDHAKKGKG